MNHHDGKTGPTELFEQCEAVDAVMATIGGYDALWDGVLFPEIIDAEYHDCSETLPIVWQTPGELVIMTAPAYVQRIDRVQALTTLLATVDELAKRCPEGLHSESIDAVLTDCPTLDELQLFCLNIIE